MSAFGDEVKRLAKEKGLTQLEVAVACGVRQSFISRLYSGLRGGIGADMLFKLSDVLGVPVEHFRPFLLPPIPLQQSSQKKAK